MIDEVLYMETRIFREFCEKMKITAKKANELFNNFKIWDYIESCYDMLHLSGDECVLNDIEKILKKRGVEI